LTELIWEGKYGKDGKKVAPLRVKLPFQTVETVNESAQQRQRTLDLFSSGRPAEWRNQLIWGDKKYVLPSLLDEFAGQVDLIYIDPPFDTGADFSFSVQVDGEGFVKEPSIIEQKAYRDTWGRGLDSYLQWLYEAAILLRELLADTGSIYIHMDWHAGHYVKMLLDEIFGVANFQNEIVWKRTSARSDSHSYNHIHDMIFLYSKSDHFTFNVQYTPYDQTYLDNFYRYTDPDTGKRFRVSDLMAAGTRKGSSGNIWRGIDPNTRGNHWKYTIEELERLDKEGRIYWPQKEGGVPGYKRYLDEMPGVSLQSIWTDISPIAAQAAENVNYDTQKPEALLERIIKSSSNEGDLVLDCFAGSGTTAAVAEKLGRRWIACDLGRFAINTTRKRLLSTPGVKPFIVQNLGKYERQLWQSAEFGEHADERVTAYRHFILDLYSARHITGYNWLHGVKAGRLVHVGAVDSPVSPGDVTQIAAEFKRAVGAGKDAPATNGIDVLGWDFAFELNEVAKQQAAQANINMRFLRIPREVLEKKAVEQGDIKFFELAALSVDAKQKERTVTLMLTDFVIPPDDVPEDVRQTITNWEQWIDYWAVDWNNHDDTFHNEWQDYRTRKKRELQKTISHTYEQLGAYVIMVKVIDILGNDTTKTLKVEVR
jgi:adenine-specific DNA-methyltransferase